MVEKAPEAQSEPGGVLVLVRHGQTEWNASGRFSGWADVSLNDRGRREAKAMGELLAEHDFYPADAYSSRLERARETLDVVLECLGGGARDRPALARHAPAWELNERHYGALTALVKRQAADQFGAEQVKNWRRGFAVRPPEMHESHPWHELIYDGGTYDDVDDGVVLPTGESLEDCEKRCVAYVSAHVLPHVAAGRHGLVSAHNNTIRCLLHALCRESEEVMTRFEMPTGGAIVLKIGGDGTVVGRQDLTPPRPVDLGDDDDFAITDDTALAWPLPGGDSAASCTESFAGIAAFLACSAPPPVDGKRDLGDDAALADAHATYRDAVDDDAVAAGASQLYCAD
ncbi:hypothetical protein JL721_1137 [Aureococcus anophagefferens]|nr:hypothetical protein JL721_1137 [Aureococcus anophagefferens]